MKIFIDFDGVLLNTNDLVIKEILKEINDDGLNEIFEELDWDKLYTNAEIINDGLNIIKKNQTILDITILTKVKHLNESVAKYKYLKNNGINLPIIFVPISLSKASLVKPKMDYLLIDDDIKNIKEWQQSGGITYHFKENSSLKFLETLK